MRLPRQKPEGPSVFHCRSHLVPEVPYLLPLEKHYFTRRFRRLAAFHDMSVLTHSVMSNHFHLLVRSPKKVRLPHAQLLKKLRRFYGPRSREVQEFEHALQGHPQLLATLRARYLARIGDLSVFMKELKEGFSRWYNRRHERQGTLWTQRFASTVVEDTPPMVLPTAAYIDLNAVRAGMVGDPRTYRFCGYGEALGGGKEARAGLGAFLPRGKWAERLAEYRKYLYVTGGHPGQRGKAVLKPEEIAKVIAQGGKVSVPEILRVRVRYFTAGVVLGSQAFVEAFWRERIKRPGSKRKSGARKMKGADWGAMRTLRDLQKDVIG